MNKNLYIELLKKYNELANSQLELYKKLCEFLSQRVEDLEKKK